MAIGRSGAAWAAAGATELTVIVAQTWEEPCSQCGWRAGWITGSWDDKRAPAGRYYIRCLACGAEHLIKK